MHSSPLAFLAIFSITLRKTDEKAAETDESIVLFTIQARFKSHKNQSLPPTFHVIMPFEDTPSSEPSEGKSDRIVDMMLSC